MVSEGMNKDKINPNNNPLLKPSELPQKAIAFPEIKPDHFEPALNEAILRARSNIENIKNRSESPNFSNTIEALEQATDDISLVNGVFYSLMSAHTNAEIQELAKKLGPIQSAFSSDLILDEKLFKKIKMVWESSEKESLNTEERQLLEKTYKDFVRNGALLKGAQRDRLRAIDERKSILTPEFFRECSKRHQ